MLCVSDEDDVPTVIAKFVRDGWTSKARQLANECLLLLQNNIHSSSRTLIDVSTDNMRHFSSLLKCCSSSSDRIIEVYKASKEKLYENEDYFQVIIIDNLRQKYGGANQRSFGGTKKCTHSDIVSAEIDVPPFGPSSNGVIATHGSIIIEQWNACCSYWRDSSARKCFDNEFCCEIAEGTDNHLILPALREPTIQIRLENEAEVIEIEQEGSLQLYDVSGVLWPAGYLLGVCLSNPVKCDAEEILLVINNVTQPVALELGTGVGFAAIALSKKKYFAKIIAVDISKSALDLTINNAYRNGVRDNMIKTIEADFRDLNSLLKLKSEVSLSNGKQGQKGFDLIIGSSLQLLFEGIQNVTSALWLSLDALLSKNNPNALVILSHVRYGDERIQVPLPSEHHADEAVPFELVRRISGDKFNMKTRDGNSSDFELVILRRRRIM